jgi:hypothetical protein
MTHPISLVRKTFKCGVGFLKIRNRRDAGLALAAAVRVLRRFVSFFDALRNKGSSNDVDKWLLKKREREWDVAAPLSFSAYRPNSASLSRVGLPIPKSSLHSFTWRTPGSISRTSRTRTS